MSKTERLTISIPTELAKDLKPHRGHSGSINVSRICSDALKRELETRRIAEEQSRHLQDAVARLRAQRLASGDPDLKMGYETGTAWALQSATYKEIKWLTAEVAARVEEGERPCDIVGEERQDVYALMPALEEMTQLIDQHEWWLGFLRAALHVWAQIEDAVDADEIRPHRTGIGPVCAGRK